MIHSGEVTTNMIKCKKYGKGIAMKLGGGWCVCPQPDIHRLQCIMEDEFGPDKSNENRVGKTEEK